ncbi:hypothetical protein [Myxococcus stipitatus]|nr:hypothetical protein [Myxococcus stipitatus]
MTEPRPELLPPKLGPWGMALWILALHPVSVVVSKVFFWHATSATESPFALSGGSYLLATAFAGAPLVAFGLFVLLLRRAAASRPSLRLTLRVGTGAFLLTSLASQILACQGASADAQGGLLFVFLPLYAAVLSAVFMVLVYGLARLRGP